MMRSVYRLVFGRPLRTSEGEHERLDRARAIGAFGLDALSSVAYGPDEILYVLVLAGSAGVAWNLPIAGAIVGLLAIVVTSYRQTIFAYPHGGGSYTVARENLVVQWFPAARGDHGARRLPAPSVRASRAEAGLLERYRGARLAGDCAGHYFRRPDARADPVVCDRGVLVFHALPNGHGAPLAAPAKFAEGAWIVLVLIPVLVMGYALSIGGPVQAVHVVTNEDDADALRTSWAAWGVAVPLVLLPSPYRTIVGPLLHEIRRTHKEAGGRVTVLLPEVVPRQWWQEGLHNQTVLTLQLTLRGAPDVVVTTVPVKLER